jgi:hypothetical protein
MYVYPVVVKVLEAPKIIAIGSLAGTCFVLILHWFFWKIQEDFELTPKWNYEFWTFGELVCEWWVLICCGWWGPRLHGTFLILARTTLILCCTYLFWEKYKRILNLHQSEFWTFVKSICELWVHFFGGETSWNISYFKLLLVWSCSPIKNGVCHEKSQWVVWELTYKKTKWSQNQVKLGILNFCGICLWTRAMS